MYQYYQKINTFNRILKLLKIYILINIYLYLFRF